MGNKEKRKLYCYMINWRLGYFCEAIEKREGQEKRVNDITSTIDQITDKMIEEGMDNSGFLAVLDLVRTSMIGDNWKSYTTQSASLVKGIIRGIGDREDDIREEEYKNIFKMFENNDIPTLPIKREKGERVLYL